MIISVSYTHLDVYKRQVTTNPLITQSRARKVLCVTYTNAAVDEIKRRLDKFTDHVEVHTIHGFIIEHIIQPFQQDLRDIMESDFGIEVSSRGKISSQVEGLGLSLIHISITIIAARTITAITVLFFFKIKSPFPYNPYRERGIISWHFAVARSFLHGNALTGILTQLHCALAAFPEYYPVSYTHLDVYKRQLYGL